MKPKYIFASLVVVGFVVFQVAGADLTMPGYESGSTETVTPSPSPTPESPPAATSTPGGLQMPQDMIPPQPLLKPGPRLIRVDPNSKIVYYVTPNNLKIAMWTTAVFNSYKNKTEDVETVTQEEFDQYRSAEYIKLKGNARVYRMEGYFRRFVTPQAAQELGISPDDVIEINKTDYNTYKAGKNISSAADIQ
jgi:hypothetical protein